MTTDVQCLCNLSELNINFGQSLFYVRLWLRDVMDGHHFRKKRFKNLSRAPSSELESLLISRFMKCLCVTAIS